MVAGTYDHAAAGQAGALRLRTPLVLLLGACVGEGARPRP